MTSRIRYAVAASLDGYIAGPNGEIDWIVRDPEIDFQEIFAQFDTLFVGRRTFDLMRRSGMGATPGVKTIVFSRSLRPEDCPDVTVVAEATAEVVNTIRAEAARDIWLFGGGSLFRTFLDEGWIDTVEVSVIPVLLGGGIPLLPPPARRAKLTLTGHHVYGSGIVRLEYAVERPADRTPGPGRARGRATGAVRRPRRRG